MKYPMPSLRSLSKKTGFYTTLYWHTSNLYWHTSNFAPNHPVVGGSMMLWPMSNRQVNDYQPKLVK